MKFNSFKAAIDAAKTHSVKKGVTTRIIRVDDGWEVEIKKLSVADSKTGKSSNFSKSSDYARHVAHTTYNPYKESSLKSYSSSSPHSYGVYVGPQNRYSGKTYKGGFTEKDAKPLTEEAIEKYRSERNKIDCSCMGEVENCHKCFGKGSYITDGFGEIVAS